MKVRIHWRRRHIDGDRLAALREVLTEHPGDDEVLLDVTGTGQTWRLPVTIDASVRTLRRDIHVATGGACAVIEGLEPAF